jgi:hypothetical protein
MIRPPTLCCLVLVALLAPGPAGGGEEDATIRANEVAAVACLRNISSAQAQFGASACVDENQDGTGEMGCFGELSGAVAARGSRSPIRPPVLSRAYRQIGADGIVRRSGYRFAIFLPKKGGGVVREGEGGGVPGGVVDAELATTVYLVYAWPEKHGVTGRRTFVLVPDGDVLATDGVYSGAKRPSPDAALAALALGITGVSRPGQPASDGLVWKVENPAAPKVASGDPAAKLVAARIHANQFATVALLRNISAAQAQFQAAAAVDEDNDGTGEFGTFGEMSGAIPLRGGTGGWTLNPPVLSEKHKKVHPDGTSRRNGYRFRIFLPDAAGHGVPEAPGGGMPAGKVSPDLAECHYAVYAWPDEHGKTGLHAFFMDQCGDVYCVETDRYSGDRGPVAGAAYPADAKAPVRIDRPAVTGKVARDGHVWVVVN